MGYIATFARQAGHNVGVLDAEAHGFGIRRTAELVNPLRPRWVGFNPLGPDPLSDRKDRGRARPRHPGHGRRTPLGFQHGDSVTRTVTAQLRTHLGQHRKGKEISLLDVRPGDIAFAWCTTHRRWNHAGIVSKIDGWTIHIAQHGGRNRTTVQSWTRDPDSGFGAAARPRGLRHQARARRSRRGHPGIARTGRGPQRHRHPAMTGGQYGGPGHPCPHRSLRPPHE
ncbi:hypothetical protein [Streptomyces sp. NPDC001889]